MLKCMLRIPRLSLLFVFLTCLIAGAADKPIQVFVLAGDEYVLENGIVGPASKPGTLEAVVAENPDYGYLKNTAGEWVSPKDVLLFDSHPIQNNTKAEAAPVPIVVEGLGGGDKAQVMGVTASLSHRLRNAIDAPILIIRHGTRHPIWFRRGSRNLSHDYRSPSTGGGEDHDGGWDVIHFNHGIHDTGYRNPESYKDKDENKYPIYMPIDQYEKNLRTIVARLKQTGATLIWARTTPVMDETPGWKAADIDRYNAVADEVMKENGVIINDLHGESIRQGFPKNPDVHSVGKFAPKVTEEILKALASREHNTKPLPRVLMIGDSITGTYWAEVQKNLDGKAYVCKNPANAGPSNRGVEHLEEWLDLKSYLLNGQEYLQLITGVKEALKHLDHTCPQYADRGAELAGVIWFQGDADGQSEAKSTVYEKHLASLIRDLRQDLDAPELPVVVTALANAKQKMNPSQQTVFDAQMAVGNPQKYPEFQGNVLSIDTRPLCKPSKECPGGRDLYSGNAESYLQIGEAMAEAILTLIRKK
jgi:lysophospholipase L1-like esterase